MLSIFGMMVAAAVASPVAPPVAAQRPVEATLSPAARSSEPFSRVRGVRELSDGRVLVADQTEKALYLVDFVAQTRRTLGQNGPGPEEYDQPTGLLALRGDTTIMLDIGNTRLATLTADGRIIATTPMFGPGMSIPRAVDLTGNLYWDMVSELRLRKREDPTADQAKLIRRTQGGRVDTLNATLTIPGGVNPSPFPDWDGWAVGPDGRIAIVRNQAQYRVDWLSTDGNLVRGTPVPFEAMRVTEEDREIFMRPVSAGGSGGGSGARMGGDPNRPPPRPRPRNDFPDRFPAAKHGEVRIGPGGRVWVERFQHMAEKRALLDVFDADGRLAARVRLPADRKVVGFGNGTLYAVQTDDDGLQWLERYQVDGALR